jgi:type II secretory pathway component PulF
VFSKVYSAIVKAAEESGTLAKTLEILGKQQKAQTTIHSRIKSALAYPIFLLVVSITVVGILMAIVVPKFVQLFINANQNLPLPTKILISINNSMRDSWPLIVSGTIGLIIISIIALRQEHMRRIVDAIILKLPGIGTINKKLLIARFSRTLGSLLNGGVDIMSAMETTKTTVTNRVFASHVNNIADEIMKGSSIAKAISKQEHFSEMAANMIAVGEESGMLSAMLLEVADIYDEESEAAIGAFTTLLGPIMIIFMGGIVTFIVFAILLPIFETSSMIK